MVQAVPALVVLTMASVTVDVPVAPKAPALPDLVIATMVAVPAPAAAPVASAGRTAPALSVVPMEATAFAVAVAPAATVQRTPASMTLLSTTVELPIVPAVPAASVLGPSSSNAMVRNENVFLTGYLPVY